jgi:hypothetical protein
MSSGSKPAKAARNAVALAQDGDPGQARLKPVEDQLFPQRAAIERSGTPHSVS